MFIIKQDNIEVSEGKDFNWDQIKDNIEGVYLLHPLLNITIGLHQCKRYAFYCEGLAMLNNVSMPRVAENLWGEKDGLYIHLRLCGNGDIMSETVKDKPDINDNVWRLGI